MLYTSSQLNKAVLTISRKLFGQCRQRFLSRPSGYELYDA